MTICEKKSINLQILGLGDMEVLEALDSCCVYDASHACNNYNGQ